MLLSVHLERFFLFSKDKDAHLLNWPNISTTTLTTNLAADRCSPCFFVIGDNDWYLFNRAASHLPINTTTSITKHTATTILNKLQNFDNQEPTSLTRNIMNFDKILLIRSYHKNSLLKDVRAGCLLWWLWWWPPPNPNHSWCVTQSHFPNTTTSGCQPNTILQEMFSKCSLQEMTWALCLLWWWLISAR